MGVAETRILVQGMLVRWGIAAARNTGIVARVLRTVARVVRKDMELACKVQ